MPVVLLWILFYWNLGFIIFTSLHEKDPDLSFYILVIAFFCPGSAPAAKEQGTLLELG
jgi:hypothetical protein